MSDKLYKLTLFFLFILCIFGVFFIYSSQSEIKVQKHFYNGKVIDYDLSMLNAYENTDLVQSKELKRSLFKTKKAMLKKVLKPVKKKIKKAKVDVPFPKVKIKGIVYSAIPKAILLVQNKERIMTEGEKLAKWELVKINKSELLFSLEGKEKKLNFGAQEFSQGGASRNTRSRGRFGSGPSGFPR
ncbi:MAG: hypothetical protein KC646_06275 [Candidatus Cloacimonetes bacterium]|nr:hypothetical protein [Candidatus Cloacimonadota bacterium]